MDKKILKKQRNDFSSPATRLTKGFALFFLTDALKSFYVSAFLCIRAFTFWFLRNYILTLP